MVRGLLRALSAALCLGLCLSASVALAAPATKGKGSGKVGKSLGPMPWYDKKRDNYREYTAAEVRKYIREPKQRRPPSGSWLNLGPAFGKVVLYTIAGILVAVLAYFLFRLWQERSPVKRLRKNEGVVVHEQIIAGLEDEEPGLLEEEELARRIEAALDASDLRRAAVLIFVFALLSFGRQDLLQLRPGRTAREYARRLARSRTAGPTHRQAFGLAAQAFEVALYRGSAPQDDLRSLWAQMQRLNTESAPG